MAQAQLIQEDFSGGSDRDVAPHLIDASAAYDYLNLVLDDDGSAYRRGGSVPFSLNAMTGVGRFLFDGILNSGRRTICADSTKTYVLGSDDVTLMDLDAAVGMPYPKQTAVMLGLVFIGGGAITAGARSSVTHTATSVVATTNGSRTVTRSSGTWSAIVVPGHLMRIGNARVYEVQSVESATSLTLRTNYQGSTATGQTAIFAPIYRMFGSDPYHSAEYVAVCHNRMVAADGRIVRFSDIGNPHSYPVNNFHELPTGAQITGLAELGGSLIVFTTDGIWTIEGLAYEIVDSNGNGQHRVQRLSEAIVLAGVAGIAGHEQRLVVPASDGIYLLDGVSTPQRISRGIERPYRAWIRWGAKFGKAVVFRGHYILPIVSSDGVVMDTFVCRLDRPIKNRFSKASWPWVRFSGDGGSTPAFAVRYGTSQLAPKLIGVQGRTGAKIVECSDFFNPESPNALDADGQPPVAQIVTRDYETGNLTENSVRSIKLRYELKGGSLKVERSLGGPNYDVAGYTSSFRKWGDILAMWGNTAGLWGTGFGPEDPAVTVSPTGGAVFEELACTPGESNGIKPFKCRVNKRARYMRYRITCGGTVETFRLRSIETFTRPSEATRR